MQPDSLSPVSVTTPGTTPTTRPSRAEQWVFSEACGIDCKLMPHNSLGRQGHSLAAPLGPWLLVLCGLILVVFCCRHSQKTNHSSGATFHTTIPPRTSSQGLPSLATQPLLMVIRSPFVGLFDRRHSGSCPNKLSPPRDFASHCLRHTTTRRTHRRIRVR